MEKNKHLVDDNPSVVIDVNSLEYQMMLREKAQSRRQQSESLSFLVSDEQYDGAEAEVPDMEHFHEQANIERENIRYRRYVDKLPPAARDAEERFGNMNI